MGAFLAYTWDLIVRGGSAAAGFLGGMNARANGGLTLLLLLMAADYVTGVIAAAMGRSKHAEHGRLSSAAGWKGLLRKALTMLVVLLSVLLDRFVNQGNAMFQSAVTWFYISNEAISLVENLARCGVPIPRRLRAMLEQMRREDEPPRNDGLSNAIDSSNPQTAINMPNQSKESPQQTQSHANGDAITTFGRQLQSKRKLRTTLFEKLEDIESNAPLSSHKGMKNVPFRCLNMGSRSKRRTLMPHYIHITIQNATR